MELICLKGASDFRHLGLIPEIPCVGKNIQHVTWKVVFDESCLYRFDYPDNHDWNKGGGVTMDLFSNHTDSTMWSWRRDIQVEGYIEVGIYSHVNGEEVVWNTGSGGIYSETLIWVKPGIELSIQLQIDRGRKTYDWTAWSKVTGAVKETPSIPFTHDKKWSRTIGAWFGGRSEITGKNSVAPNEMKIKISRTWSK